MLEYECNGQSLEIERFGYFWVLLCVLNVVLWHAYFSGSCIGVQM